MPTVIHWNAAEDGTLTEAAMRQKLVELGYSVSKYVYPPGTYFPPHTHEVDKMDGILSGQFLMTLRGDSVVLQAGDRLEIPRGELHSAQVVGQEYVVSLDAIK